MHEEVLLFAMKSSRKGTPLLSPLTEKSLYLGCDYKQMRSVFKVFYDAEEFV